MTRAAVVLMILFAACGGSEPNTPRVSKEPISVRGWIVDVEGSPHASVQTVETDSVRRLELFQSTTVWVDNAPYVSGGVGPNGSFLLLDVPPGDVTITFTAPGAPAAKLKLQKIPGNADVFVPAILLKKDSVALLDPKSLKVRVAMKIDRPAPNGVTTVVAGFPVPVMNTPIAQMNDRHDYPNPPNAPTPLATVR